jgi:hypothetical protein
MFGHNGSLHSGISFKSVTPYTLLKFIASGVFGKDAFSGGIEFIQFGLFIHILIAFACTLTYFLVYPKLKLLHKNILVSSFFVALIGWTITTRLIIPMSKIRTPPFNFTKAFIALSVLYFCIGLPIIFFAKHFMAKSGFKIGDRTANR